MVNTQITTTNHIGTDTTTTTTVIPKIRTIRLLLKLKDVTITAVGVTEFLTITYMIRQVAMNR